MQTREKKKDRNATNTNTDKQEFIYNLLLISNNMEPQRYNDLETSGTHFDKEQAIRQTPTLPDP